MFDFVKEVGNVGGWLTKEEGEFLYKAALGLVKGDVIVEIGSWKGRSTICLGLGSKDGGGASIYAIDPHTGSQEQRRNFGKVDTYQDFLKNIKTAGVSGEITVLKMTSQEAVSKTNGEVQFVLVDGAHEFNLVKLDFDLWFPKLAEGGVIAFHDCWQQFGVHLFTTMVLLTSKRVRRPKLVDTLTVIEKVESNGLVDRFYNIFFVLYRLSWGWTGVLKIDFWGTKK